MARIFNLNLIRSQLYQTYQKIQFRSNKSFIPENVVELDEKTLTGRLLNYLNTCNNQDFKLNDCTPKLDQINCITTDLRHYDIDQIKSSFKCLKISQSNFYLFKALDKECYARVKSLKTSDIFELLHIYMSKVPHMIINCTFYQCAINELSRRLKFLDKNEIVCFIFYIGLRKKMTREHAVLRKCVDHLTRSNFDSLTVEDVCVICNTTFKTTTKITEQFFSSIVHCLYNHLELFKDPAFFITLLKTIRQNRYQDEDLLSTMTCTIFFNKTLEHYSFSALAHILAVYSDYLYYDVTILKAFTERCISILKNSKVANNKEHISSYTRLKDIKRFLWCLSNLNYKLDISDIKTVIIPNILKRVESGDVEKNYSSLIEITLYLWMLNYHAYELVPYFLTKENIEFINTLTTPIKQRLNLLLSCIFYEDKELLRDLDVKPISIEYDLSKQIEKRPLLQKVIAHLNHNPNYKEINKFEVSCQIPGIHVVGITGYKKDTQKVVYIELLDEYTTLKNTKGIPTGIMQLKLRLLDHMDESLILLDSEEIKYLSTIEIQQLLLDEIDFVC